MVDDLTAGLSALKTAFDIAKGIIDMNDAASRNAAVIALQEKILAAQQSQMSLVEEAKRLEDENTRLKSWEEEKQRYSLYAVGSHGAKVYELKEGEATDGVLHYLCTNCFDTGQKSILQDEHHAVGRAMSLVCHRCGLEMYAQGQRREQHGTRPRR